VLFLGVAFKKNVGDTRNSPALKIIEILNGRVGRIIYNDPHVPEVKIWGERVRSVPLTGKVLKEAAITVITAAHSAYDYHWIVEHANIIFDTRNATKGIKSPKVYRLGAPNP
ncbi:UDP-N-acetyl-D-glucosamine dehydrogenase, partial [bacterium]